MKRKIVLILCFVMFSLLLCACAPVHDEESDGRSDETYEFSDTEFFTLTTMIWQSKSDMQTFEKKIGVGNYVDEVKRIVSSLEPNGETEDSLSEPTTAYLLSVDGKLYRFGKSFSTAAVVSTPDGMGVSLRVTAECRKKLAQMLKDAPNNTYEGTVKNGQGEIVNTLSTVSTVYIRKAELKMKDSPNKIYVTFDSTVPQDVVIDVTSFQSDDSFSDGYVLDPVTLQKGEQTVDFDFKGFDDINQYGYYLKIDVTAADRTKTTLTLHIEP